MSALREKAREWHDARRALISAVPKQVPDAGGIGLRYDPQLLERLANAEFALARAVHDLDREFGQGVRPMTKEEARQRLFAEAIAELKHAAIFIRTPETMHLVGVKIYDGLIKRMDDFDREFGR